MSIMELAKNRYSERFFDSRPVEQDKLDKILEAGRIVPTACNYQPSGSTCCAARRLWRRPGW